MITQKEFFNTMPKEWDNICQYDTNKIKHISMHLRRGLTTKFTICRGGRLEVLRNLL